MGVIQYFLIYLGILNLLGFILMGVDKAKAKRQLRYLQT